MSFCRRLLLFFSLFLFFSFLLIVSNSEASRIKIKKAAQHHKSQTVAQQKLQPVKSPPTAQAHQPSSQLEEAYLVSELDPQQNSLLQKAMGLLGIKYRFGGSSYAGIDCSAFVRKVFTALHLPLPRTAREQFAVGKDVPKGELQKGDLLFYRTYAGFPSHVGIYIGNDLMIHASSEGGRVMISRIDSPYFLARFIGARRVPAEGGGGFLWELAGGDESEKGKV